ncbi:MAG: hypothetical protein FWB96_01470 [Defluviitaleaceae bacterium]|nr:hypothetical protein [Defluviitaleaceae bacterium]MCL2261637.1 hypothetical protein [Defluviitaleaceae bacterium]
MPKKYNLVVMQTVKFRHDITINGELTPTQEKHLASVVNNYDNLTDLCLALKKEGFDIEKWDEDEDGGSPDFEWFATEEV